MYNALKIVFPCILSLFVCQFVAGGWVNPVNPSCLEVKDMLPRILFSLINESLKELTPPPFTRRIQDSDR